MTMQNYLIAWFVYLLSAGGLFALFWVVSKNIPSPRLAQSLRLSMIVLLLTPYFSSAEQNWLAPAILITLFEAVFGDIHIALKAAIPLIVLLATALLFSLFSTARLSTTKQQHKST